MHEPSIMAPVRIYTTPTCTYCMAALALLRNKRIPFEQINVAGDSTARAWLVEATGQRTVPQVFIGDRSIGGYTELSALDRRGDLDPLLAGERV